jgi:hypothetical protein
VRPIFQENMEHPLPPGIFVEMKPSPNEFDDWTEEDFDNEIRRLRERIKELESQKVAREEHDDDDIMHDPDVHEMVENGEHTCHMFDAPCQACEDEEEDPNQHVDKLRAHFC